jgi:hypothetical protein
LKTVLADEIAATFANVSVEDADLLVGAIKRLRRYGPAGSVQLKRRTFPNGCALSGLELALNIES